jgi:uncharacterized membrane protein (Fun14 family)
MRELAYWCGLGVTVIGYALWCVLDVVVYIVGLYTVVMWLLSLGV